LRTPKLLAVIAGTGIALAACGSLSSLHAQAPNGKALFEANCVACHGEKGDGDTIVGKQLQASDLRSPDVQKKKDAELTTSIMDGKNNKMPPFKAKLKPEEVTALLKYVRGTLAAKK
jgi:mono/diheme cytochrome c family protein